MIIFRKLTFKNILSVGNTPVSVQLDDSKTTLIHGTNGSGKSTILDALTYVLFNKPFRKINLPQLLNSQNKKGLLTEIEFTVGRNEYMVRRGIKPKVFEIWKNGEMIDARAADKDNQAHLEQNILKLSFKSFCQVVILGSASYTPFMQLNTTNRRDCVEDFLDIKVFSSMALLAKERLRGVKERLTEVKHDMSNLMYKVDVQQDHIKTLQHRHSSDSKQLEEIITSRGVVITKKLGLIENTQENVRCVQGLLSQVMDGKPDRKLMELNKIIAKFETKIEALSKDSKFYEDNDSCPVCKQDIEYATKQLIISGNQVQSKKFYGAAQEAVSHLDEFQGDMRIATNRQKHIDSLQKSIFEFETEVRSLQREVKAAEDKLSEMQMDTSCLDKEEGKLEVLRDNAKELKARYDKLSAELKDHDVVVSLLKDSGIKTQIVKKYLPVMNNCIRRYLSELDLNVHFTLDEEFNEHVASPLHRDYSYASFSEGQKARIDLALCFTWREIGKVKNSVSTNILFLDEVFSSSLDDTGKELLMKIIRYDLPDNQNILVVDHTLSDNFKEKFDRSIIVNQVKGFSQYS